MVISKDFRVGSKGRKCMCIQKVPGYETFRKFRRTVFSLFLVHCPPSSEVWYWRGWFWCQLMTQMVHFCWWTSICRVIFDSGYLKSSLSVSEWLYIQGWRGGLCRARSKDGISGFHLSFFPAQTTSLMAWAPSSSLPTQRIIHCKLRKLPGDSQRAAATDQNYEGHKEKMFEVILTMRQ